MLLHWRRFLLAVSFSTEMRDHPLTTEETDGNRFSVAFRSMCGPELKLFIFNSMNKPVIVPGNRHQTGLPKTLKQKWVHLHSVCMTHVCHYKWHSLHFRLQYRFPSVIAGMSPRKVIPSANLVERRWQWNDYRLLDHQLSYSNAITVKLRLWITLIQIENPFQLLLLFEQKLLCIKQHAHTHANTHTHTHARTHARTHALTHTHYY